MRETVLALLTDLTNLSVTVIDPATAPLGYKSVSGVQITANFYTLRCHPLFKLEWSSRLDEERGDINRFFSKVGHNDDRSWLVWSLLDISSLCVIDTAHLQRVPCNFLLNAPVKLSFAFSDNSMLSRPSRVLGTRPP